MTEPRPFGGAFEGRRIFLTGHTGFKGSWLAAWLLALGADVTGYALQPDTEPALFTELGIAGSLEHIVADVRDGAGLARSLAAARPDVVIHMAAQPLVRRSYREPLLTFDVNVMGTANLMEAVRGSGARAVVNVTTDKVYANPEDGAPFAETDPLGGLDPYSASKACSELVTAAYRHSFLAEEGILVATARAGNVIGGGDWADERLLPDCVRSLVRGESIVVRNPAAVRPWQHVLEPLAGYLTLAARLLSGQEDAATAFNFGPLAGDERTVGDVVARAIAVWGSGEWHTAALERQPHEANLLHLDASNAREVLLWRPVWDADEAIATSMEWYRAYYDDPAGAAGLVARDIESYTRCAERVGSDQNA